MWNDSSGKKICGKKWGLSKTSGVCKQWDRVIRKQRQSFSQLWKPIYSTGYGYCSLPYSLYPLFLRNSRLYNIQSSVWEKKKLILSKINTDLKKKRKQKGICILTLTQLSNRFFKILTVTTHHIKYIIKDIKDCSCLRACKTYFFSYCPWLCSCLHSWGISWVIDPKVVSTVIINRLLNLV